MDAQPWVLLTGGFFIIAFLYSSVGHAGASGYIAVMSLLNLAPEEIKPTALVLNICVASITAWQFYRAGHFAWTLFWPFAILAIPLAFAGGYAHLPTDWFKALVGIVLLASAVRLLIRPPDEAGVHMPPRALALGMGGALGLLAGLTGTGGGIFLTPVLVFKKWARIKTAGAVSALFILVNSVAGLIGTMATTWKLPGITWFLIAAVVAGGASGSYFGSRRFDPSMVKRLLAIVLVIAGFKLILR
ncbi:MAG: sulfite exporter TauE/SafE family protein [Kiritimatiellota bacterium]|nr:sulfite exporter TauE/SafE family protein [Kiritimatiellota bacterium]